MDTSKTNNLRICCPEGSKSSLQLATNKDKLDFFKDLLQLVNRMEKGSEEVNIGLCPVAIRLENKYKCCKARIADIEGKLEKAEEENKILKDKLNAIEILSGNQYCELNRMRGEVEIQKWERFETETKLKQMVTHVKDVNKAIADLGDIQLGDNQDLLLPQTKSVIDSRLVKKKVCEGESVNIFAELTTRVNDQFQKWKNIQMKTRSEVRTLSENLKKMEERLLKSKSLNAKELVRVEVTQSKISFLQENSSEVPLIKHVAMPPVLVQRPADESEEISGNGNNEKHKQTEDPYSNQSVNKTCQNIVQPHKQEESLHRKSVDTMASPRVGEIPSEKVRILRKIHSSKTSKAPVIKPLPIPSILIPRSADGKLEISKHVNSEQNPPDKNLHSNRIDEQCEDKPCINNQLHNEDESESTCQDNLDCNTEAMISKEVQQQSVYSGPSQDKQPQDINTVKETHYQIQREGNMDRQKFHCKCGKSYSFMLLLDQHIHMMKKVSMKAFQCNICRKKFGTKYDLSFHMIWVHEKECRCRFCGKILATEQILQNHLKIHRGQHDHKCYVCNKSYVSKRELTVHKRTHLDEKKKKHKCSICDRKFLHKSHLKVHMRFHTNEKPYKCNSCGKRFTTGGNLTNHEIIHSGEKPYKCSICSASFGLKGNLKMHERIHTNQRLYSCSKCPRAFNHRQNLKTHLLARHSPSRIPAFHCVFCEKAFLSKTGYYYHIRAHVGESRVFCEYCDKGFSDKFSKDGHIRRRHSSRKAT